MVAGAFWVLAFLVAALGVTVSFCGYSMYITALRIIGFILGFIIGYLPSNLAGLELAPVVGIATGVLAAVFAPQIVYLMVFIQGFVLGFLFAGFLNILLGLGLGFWPAVVFGSVFGVGGGLLAVKLKRLAIMVVTAFLGAGIAVLPIMVAQSLSLNDSPWAGFFWIAIGVSGFLIQYNTYRKKHGGSDPPSGPAAGSSGTPVSDPHEDS